MDAITKTDKWEDEDTIVVQDPILMDGVKITVEEAEEKATIILNEVDALVFARTLYSGGDATLSCSVEQKDKLELDVTPRRAAIEATMDGVMALVYLQPDDAKEIGLAIRTKYLGVQVVSVQPVEPDVTVPEWTGCGDDSEVEVDHLIEAGDGATIDLTENEIGETVLEARYKRTNVDRVVFVRLNADAAEVLMVELAKFLNEQDELTVNVTKSSRTISTETEKLV